MTQQSNINGLLAALNWLCTQSLVAQTHHGFVLNYSCKHYSTYFGAIIQSRTWFKSCMSVLKWPNQQLQHRLYHSCVLDVKAFYAVLIDCLSFEAKMNRVLFHSSLNFFENMYAKSHNCLTGDYIKLYYSKSYYLIKI